MAWIILPDDVTQFNSLDAYRELRLAMRQRAFSGFFIGSQTPTPTQLETINTNIRISDMQRTMDEMLQVIPLLKVYMANQTDNSGDWNGLNTFPPRWTEADALVAIGDLTRERYTALELTESLIEIRWEWVKQMMQLVDLMRWVVREDNSNFSFVSPSEAKKKTGSGASVAAVTASYNSASEVDKNGSELIGQGSTRKSGTYDAQSTTMRDFRIGDESIQLASNIDSIETYFYMKYPSSSEMSGIDSSVSIKNYDAMGNAWTIEDAYNLIRTDIAPGAVDIDFEFDGLDIPDIETVDNIGRAWVCNFPITDSYRIIRYTFDQQT